LGRGLVQCFLNASTNVIVYEGLATGSIPTTGLLSGASVRRTVQFTWPISASSAGNFIFRIVVDSANQVAEVDSLAQAESNNQIEFTRQSGPDLQVVNVRVQNPETVHAGGLVTVIWQDINTGQTYVPAAYQDRIVVHNVATGQVLLDTSVPFAPSGNLAQWLPTGGIQNRVFTFKLADGIKAVGDIQITVTADQSSTNAGVLFETNLTNDAEANNSASVAFNSTAGVYADLAATAVTIASASVSGRNINIGWSITNQGGTATSSQWNDRIILSRDNVIGNADDITLGTVRHAGAIQPGGSYSQNGVFLLPTLADGNYYIGVQADSGAEVVEPDTRADNFSAPHQITLTAPITDLKVDSVKAPANTNSGDEIIVNWVVRNVGNAITDSSAWSDRIVFSRSPITGIDETTTSATVLHFGAVESNGSYSGQARVVVPRDFVGDYYIRVYTNANNGLNENGSLTNNSAATSTPLTVALSPAADLRVTTVIGSANVLPGNMATVSYTSTNAGSTKAIGPWRDRVYLDTGVSGLIEVATSWVTADLAASSSVQRSVTFLVPDNMPEGTWRWVVKTDTDNAVYERDFENNNQTQSSDSVFISRADFVVTQIAGPSLVTSGNTINIQWQVTNNGNTALGNWFDQIYLSQNGNAMLIKEVAHSGPLSLGESYNASTELDIPLGFSGPYQIVVVTNNRGANYSANPNSSVRENNLANNTAIGNTVHVTLDAYADLSVSNVSAPLRTIADPATLNVTYTVNNIGTGAGRTSKWTDQIIFSQDDILGNSDDFNAAQYVHQSILEAGQSYTNTVAVQLPGYTSGRYTLFVVSDSQNQVFENGNESNNSASAIGKIDIMPIAYADLQVESVTAQALSGVPSSGQSLKISWTVANRGIGITDAATWSDSIWLSRNADGSDIVTQLGLTSHLGQLAVDDAYSRTYNVALPEGIEGTHYINVRTGGPYEFVYTNNNTGHSIGLPITLSRSPDLIVESIELPAAALEGALIDISWTVLNQGQAAASGVWVDTVVLVPTNGSAAITVGTFSYDRGNLEAGIRYTRTEQVRLPSKIEGQYRIKVITNANLGVGGAQIYEHSAARINNTTISTGVTDVSLNDRPDLRVSALLAPERVIAGGSAAVKYSISNQGPKATSGRWVDSVYLSLDGNYSGDDLLVGRFDSGAALAPTESYSNESALVSIPIRYRGDAYLIVVADGNNNIDEYPNEANNVRAVKFYVEPIPFADLVTSDVVAPDQAVHGSSISVNYKVTNKGSNTTRGESAATNSWTDSVWLTVDKTRPNPGKGDILLGTVTHSGNLAVGADYLGSAQVGIPDGVRSGKYFITVWSDSYDAILEDTLASNLNPDDPNQFDNNNYKARAIDVLGIAPPDLTVTDVQAQAQANAGDAFTFSYSVQNRGDLFESAWEDSVYITNATTYEASTQIWYVGSYKQQRSLANGEKYTVNQTVTLPPSVTGRYVVVKTDTYYSQYYTNGVVGEISEVNNTKTASTLINPAPADLRVSNVVTLPENYSGEETTIAWTVVNDGAAVWGGYARMDRFCLLQSGSSF
jgi:CARDB